MLTQVKQESGYSGRSTTTGNAIEVVRRGTTIGAEIQGVDFNRPLDDVTRDAILSALADWKVVYFRNAHITPEQQKAFGARFGERLCIRLRHTSRVFLKS